MDIQLKRLLLLCLILGLGGLAMAGCAVATSQAATVRGQVTPTATPLPGFTRVSIRVSSPDIIVPAPRVSVAEAEATPAGVSSQANVSVQATAGAYQSGGMYYTVVTGDTLYSISKRYGLTVEQLAAANGIVYPYYIQIGQTLYIPPASATPGGRTHLVQTGENLYRISKLYGLTVEDIARANNIPPPYHIQVGQTLIIPGYGWLTPTPWGTPTSTPWWTPSPTPWWTPSPTPWWTPTPTTSPEMLLYASPDGKFSVQYPGSWQRIEPEQKLGYFCFWAQKTEYPLSTLVGVASKPNGQRSSVEVLREYQNMLPTLLGTRLGQPSLSWEGEPNPYLIAGNLGQEQYGLATSYLGRARIRLIAVVNDRCEYMVLTAAQPEFWDSEKSIMEFMIGTFNFLP